jgi:hypothetical protein
MPHDPMQAASALARLQVAEAKCVEAQEERRLAILDAVRADNSLQQVADIAHCSRETVRRIVAADGQVTIELGGHEYRLSGKTIGFVLYRLQGFGAGAFAPNPLVHGTDDTWLPVAGGLAAEIDAARSNANGEPVHLSDAKAFALHQSLLQSQKENPGVLLDLTEALRVKCPHNPRKAA